MHTYLRLYDNLLPYFLGLAKNALINSSPESVP